MKRSCATFSKTNEIDKKVLKKTIEVKSKA